MIKFDLILNMKINLTKLFVLLFVITLTVSCNIDITAGSVTNTVDENRWIMKADRFNSSCEKSFYFDSGEDIKVEVDVQKGYYEMEIYMDRESPICTQNSSLTPDGEFYIKCKQPGKYYVRIAGERLTGTITISRD